MKKCLQKNSPNFLNDEKFKWLLLLLVLLQLVTNHIRFIVAFIGWNRSCLVYLILRFLFIYYLAKKISTETAA